MEEEAINQSIPAAYGEAVRELNLTPIGKPVIDKVETGGDKPIRFSAVFEHLPEFELKRVKDFNFNWEIVKVTDEDVDREVENIRQSFAELESVSGRSAQKGDYAIINYDGAIDGVPFEGGSAKGAQVCLGEGRLLKEFEEGIVGMSLGDVKEVDVPFPENYQSKELAGKKSVFKITLNEIKEKKFPEFTDAFVKENLQEESLEALRTSIRSQMEKTEEETGKQDLKEKMFLKLHEANAFDIPESLVESQARMMAYSGMRRIGFTDDMISQSRERFLKYQEAILPTARTSVISQLIADKLARMEKIEVTEAELEEELKQDHASHGPHAGGAGRKREEGHRDYVRAKVMDDKVFAFLMANNKVEKVYIDRKRNISDNETK